MTLENGQSGLGRRRSMRIMHCTGPGDIVGTFEHWCVGEHDPHEMSITYSSQFYDLCERRNVQALVVSCHAERREVRQGRFWIVHRPVLWDRERGIRFHLGQVLHGLRMAWWAIRFRADVAVVAMGTHWFMLGLMWLAGIKIVPTLHNVLWPKKVDGGRPRGVIMLLNHIFFRHCCTAVMAVSREIGQQVTQLTDGRHAPILEFLPIYRRETFSELQSIDPHALPLQVLYLGRIEEAKGVFDLLDICGQLVKAGLEVVFHMCGDGSALDRLRAETSCRGLGDRFQCHGHTYQADTRRLLDTCQVLIVPTRTAFTEGFAKTVAEGVMAGRAVIASTACPALPYFGAAVLQVAADATDGYRQTIDALYRDRSQISKVVEAGEQIRGMFYDPSRGWGSALQNILSAIEENRLVEPVSWLQANR